jgi:hypothetical protein
VANTSTMGGFTPSAYVPTQFQEDIDVAACALDEQLEQLQRHYAAACRASARARIEIEDLEKRDDIPQHLLNHARRQHAAADTRCARLLCAIEGLEERLEKE